MCVGGLRGKPRRPPTSLLPRLRLDGILLCEVHGRCRDRHEEGARAHEREHQNGGRAARSNAALSCIDRRGRGHRGRAERAGLTLSAYLRAAALNYRIKSVYDLDAEAELVRVDGDFGRVAGQLKLWLVEKLEQDARRFEVDQMMTEFRVS